MVTGTASALGTKRPLPATVVEAAELCRARPCAYIILDLGMSDIEIAPAVARLQEAAGAVPMIAFGSHVNKARLDEAPAAGCAEVLPRSKFSAMPALLRRYFDGN